MFTDYFLNQSIWLNLVFFAIAASVIWTAGTRLERYTDKISARTGLGQAFGGMILLAGATSLPELATTVTSGLTGNVNLAVHNLLGGDIMQTAILAFIDVVVVRGALTCFAPNFSMLLQGVGLILLLSVTLVAMALGGRGNFSVGGVTLGLGPLLILAAYLLSAYTVYRLRDEPRWKPVDNDGCDDQPPREESEEAGNGPKDREGGRQTSLASLYVRFGIGSLFILIAGWAIVMVSDALAEQTGLGTSFIGATLVAVSTSLPEVSTTLAAARNQNYNMAISNVFGSNSFNVAQLFVLGLVYTEAPIFREVAPSAFFATGMVILVTCVYLWGMLERRNRTILNMGYDSAAVLVLYLLGTWVLFIMR